MAANEFEEFLQQVVDGGSPLSAQGVVTLSGLSPEEVEVLKRLWTHIPVERRQEVIERLALLAEENVDLNFESVFIIGVEDGDADVRRQAVMGLWESEERKVIEPLVRLLRTDAEEPVRSAAAQVLGQFAYLAEVGKLLPQDAQRVVQTLLAAVNDVNETPEVQRQALEALGPISSAEVQELISESSDSDDDQVRASALYAMSRSGNEDWLPFIIDEMAAPSPKVRFEAAHAAGRLANEEAIPSLLALIDDEDPDVQWAAVNALGLIGGPRAEEALRRCLMHPDERVQDAAQDALEDIQAQEDPLRVLGGAVVEREIADDRPDEDE